MNSRMSREERLGRRLLRAMGLHIDHDLKIHFMNGHYLYYSIFDWHSFHFGDASRNSFFEAVQYMNTHCLSFQNDLINIPVQKYRSLDELDIQLTLIGENHD